MTQIPVEFEFKIVSEGGGDPSDEIRRLILEWPDVRPCSVLVDDEKAAFIEFGTGPAKDKSKKYFGTTSPVEQAFRDWVRIKKGITDSLMCKQVARTYYHRAMEEGMPPMPFFRSSYFNVIDEICPSSGEPSKWLEHNSIEDLAQYIANTMISAIYDMDIFYTGELVESIGIEVKDVNYNDSKLESGGSISEELWDDPEIGVNNKKPPSRFYEA